jgi:hypothetical protein
MKNSTTISLNEARAIRIVQLHTKSTDIPAMREFVNSYSIQHFSGNTITEMFERFLLTYTPEDLVESGQRLMWADGVDPELIKKLDKKTQEEYYDKLYGWHSGNLSARVWDSYCAKLTKQAKSLKEETEVLPESAPVVEEKPVEKNEDVVKEAKTLDEIRSTPVPPSITEDLVEDHAGSALLALEDIMVMADNMYEEIGSREYVEPHLATKISGVYDAIGHLHDQLGIDIAITTPYKYHKFSDDLDQDVHVYDKKEPLDPFTGDVIPNWKLPKETDTKVSAHVDPLKPLKEEIERITEDIRSQLLGAQLKNHGWKEVPVSSKIWDSEDRILVLWANPKRDKHFALFDPNATSRWGVKNGTQILKTEDLGKALEFAFTDKALKEDVGSDTSADVAPVDEKRLRQLAAMGLIAKSDVSKTLRAVHELVDGKKQMSSISRELTNDLLLKLIGLITGDDALFAKTKTVVK